jgi:hypothetical protein
MYVTKRYKNDGTYEVLAKKPRITQALFQHRKAMNALCAEGTGDVDDIVTVNPKGIIYGYNWDLRHFERNKDCAFRLKYGSIYEVDSV